MYQNLLNLIPSAEETRKTTAESEELKRKIAEINKRIQNAKEHGERRCYFCCAWCDDLDHVLREMYAAKGYRFCPTGYIGGVWQSTTDICW